jgi:hypothetical protein
VNSISFKVVNDIVDIQGEQITEDSVDVALINGGKEEVEVLVPYVYEQGSSKPPENPCLQWLSIPMTDCRDSQFQR